MTQLQLSMLGAFRATLDTEPPATFRTVKERALLVYLAVEANRPHSREALAALLWPEKSEQVARRNLSTALTRLRNALHDLTTELPFLLITPQTVHLNPQAEIWSDIGALTALFDACDAHHHRHVETCRACFGRLQQAVALYREEFLVGFSPESLPFEEWARTQRETLHRRALDGMQSLARACERRGDYAGMQRAAQRQLALEPWRELAHRQLMRALTLTGQRDAALAQYRSCRQALQKELGVAPDEKTQELFAAIQSGSRLLVESATFNLPPANLPTPLTPLVGRERELARLADLFDDVDTRLVTLMGAGGIGKSRLALAAAQNAAGMFQEGVHWVSLSEVDLAAGASSRVAALAAEILTSLQAAGLLLRSSELTPEQALRDGLRDMELLLVLDNFEQLLSAGAQPESAADFVLQLLQQAPRIVVLVTSRERLHLRVEQVLRLGGLPAPGAADLRDPQRQSGLTEFPSVQLFAERAGRAAANFVLNSETLASVGQLCQYLGGHPLAIELAAAGVDRLQPAEIAAALHTGPDALCTILHDVPPRQRSMRAVFEHSWNLLSRAERAALAQASVFRGGFMREAALAVIRDQGSGDRRQSPDITEDRSLTPDPCLAALVNKSLLRRTEAGRYEMHELVQQFAAKKLEAGDRRA